jgi:hypothetical protein
VDKSLVIRLCGRRLGGIYDQPMDMWSVQHTKSLAKGKQTAVSRAILSKQCDGLIWGCLNVCIAM